MDLLGAQLTKVWQISAPFLTDSISLIEPDMLQVAGLPLALQLPELVFTLPVIFIALLGLGFGIALQHLASNFWGGICLMVARPVKVGDFIEIDNLVGTVGKISLCFTFIQTNRDACVCVPNHLFLREHVIKPNELNRKYPLPIPVVIPMEQDSNLVTEALIAAARQESRVLTLPSPNVWFKGYGQEAIQLELSVWIENPREMESIKSALYYLIDGELRARRIANPSPQENPQISQVVSMMEQLQTTWESTISTQKNAGYQSEPSKSRILIDLLRQVSYFANLTEAELLEFIKIGYRRTLAEGQILFNEGDPGDAFYIILSGSVEIFVPGLEKHLATLKLGSFFGELSLILGIPRTASVRGLEATILFAIDKPGLEKILQERSELAEVIVQELSKHREELARRQKQLREMGLLDVEEENTQLASWVRQRIKKLFFVT